MRRELGWIALAGAAALALGLAYVGAAVAHSTLLVLLGVLGVPLAVVVLLLARVAHVSRRARRLRRHG